MPAENLTRIEAAERAELVGSVLSYTVELDLMRKGEEVFGATTTVKFNKQPGWSIYLH